MGNTDQGIEFRLSRVESSLRRWKLGCVLLAVCLAGAVGLGFQQQRVVKQDRIWAKAGKFDQLFVGDLSIVNSKEMPVIILNTDEASGAGRLYVTDGAKKPNVIIASDEGSGVIFVADKDGKRIALTPPAK